MGTTSLRIGIDASLINLSSGRGFRRYVLGMIQALAAVSSSHHYAIFSEDPFLSHFPPVQNRRFSVTSSRRYIPFRYWEHANFLGILTRGFDLVHFPCMDIWYSHRGKSVVTIQDLAPIHFPDKFFLSSCEEKNYHRHLKKIGDLSDLIICGSHYSAEDVKAHLKLSDQKVKVIYHAVDPTFLEGINPSSQRSLPSQYFLFVGALDFRKNIPLLLEAFDIYRSRGGKADLVLAGRQDPARPHYFPPVVPMLEAMKERKAVHWLQDVSDEELPSIYRRALAVVFPSRMEGFGYPLVEAMASEIPIISVKKTSLTEIGGDAAFWSEMESEALALAMKRLEEDGPLRQALIQKGRERKKLFSLALMGEGMVKAYESVAAL